MIHGLLAFVTVHNKQDHIRRFHGQLGLGLHLIGEFIGNSFSDAAGVHDFKGNISASAHGGEPVARDAGAVMHDGDVAAREPVEERGLAHVGTSDDGDHRVRVSGWMCFGHGFESKS